MKSQNFFAQCPKKKRNSRHFFKNPFRSNCSCKHAECSLVALQLFLTNGRKLFPQCPETIKTLDSSFWRPCWKISVWMPKNVCSVCEKDKKYLIFFSKKLFKMNLPTGRKQFAQPCQKSFARRRKIFGSFLKNNKTHTNFSIKCFPSKFFFGKVHLGLGNPAGSLLIENWKISLNEL